MSDENDGYDFAGGSAQLRSLIPRGLSVEELNRGELDPVTARHELLATLNRGPKLVNYYGHGSMNGLDAGLATTGADGT